MGLAHKKLLLVFCGPTLERKPNRNLSKRNLLRVPADLADSVLVHAVHLFKVGGLVSWFLGKKFHGQSLVLFCDLVLGPGVPRNQRRLQQMASRVSFAVQDLGSLAHFK